MNMNRSMSRTYNHGYALLIAASIGLATLAGAERVAGRATGGVAVSKIPERPKYPVKMDTMSDAEFGKLFFAEIDLDYPGLAPVKTAVARGDYPTALNEWAKVFIGRLQRINPVPWPTHNWLPLDMPMTPDRVVLKHEVVKDFGPVGQMDWYGLKDWGLHVNCLWHTKAIIFKVEDNLKKFNETGGQELSETMRGQHQAVSRQVATSKYTNEQLYTRWAGIWRDFVNNNWRIGMPLADDAELRKAKLAEAGLEKEPPEWGSRIAFGNQALVSWLVGNWFAETQHAVQAAPEEFRRFVSPRTQAEMVYFMIVWPIENLTNQRTMPLDKLARGCPNQSQDKSVQLLRFAVIAPEVHRGKGLLDLTFGLIKTILGMDGYFFSTTDQQKDGSGTENSYNYMTSLLHAGESWLSMAETMEARPDWFEPARQALSMRRRFLANLVTPTGLQPLAKGPHNGVSPVPLVGRGTPPPPYTSLAFPYHGLYMMRDGWSTNALYLSLVNCRRGQGHDAEDANSVILEAYGRYMLVHNAGEGWGNSPYFGSSWAKNTVHVDGLAQLRNTTPARGAFKEPQDGRWYASSHFDFAESTYRYGYGPAPVDMKDKPKIAVTNVTHTRQAIFVKGASLWFVVDIMDAPADSTHEYSQMWHFNRDFPQNAVMADAGVRTIATHDPAGPNLFLYQAATAPLSYRKFYGEGWTGKEEKHTSNMPSTVRGWHNTGGGYDGKSIFPAVDVYATWKGQGTQTIVTAMVPSPGTVNRVVKADRIEDADRIGLVLNMRDGTRVEFTMALNGETLAFAPGKARAQVCVVVERPGDTPRGLLLGTTGFAGKRKIPASCEFALDKKQFSVVSPIQSPTTFRWVGPAGREVPDYGYGTR
jgi:hypothetical protein